MANVKTWKNAVKCAQLASIILVGIVAIGSLTHNNDNIVRVDNQFLQEGEIVSKHSPTPRCNFFSGKWVYDNISYPLYKEGECSLMGDQFTSCEKYGRKDLNYQNWRWQPYHCDIPRFNGIAFLEKIRGKKLVFVGDSLGRNQWESMLCLIESYLPPSPKPRKLQLKSKGNFYKFHFVEYDVTIGYYWAPFLVESNCDDPEHHKAIRTRIIRPESIEKHGRYWIDADILVFDSFAWWTAPKMKILWGSFDSPDAIYKEVEMNLRRYEIVLNSWSEWLEVHINRIKTKMFFMSHSPFHFGDTWRGKYFCYNQTEPIFDESYWPTSVMRSLMQVAESIIEKLEQRGIKVEYLNITQLSGYRKDAHPSIFRNFTSNISLEGLIRDSNKYSDCMHWCLPGVPDVWNQILYYYIMHS